MTKDAYSSSPAWRLATAFVVTIALSVAATGCANERRTHPALQAQRQATQVPAPLPQVSLPAVGSSAPLDLGQLKGPAVLNFWASWCSSCVREMPVLQEFSQAHPSVRVIGIGFEEKQPKAAADLIKKLGLTYDQYVDETGELDGNKPFPSLRGLPFLALVDGSGQVVFQGYAEMDDVSELEALVSQHLGAEALS